MKVLLTSFPQHCQLPVATLLGWTQVLYSCSLRFHRFRYPCRSRRRRRRIRLRGLPPPPVCSRRRRRRRCCRLRGQPPPPPPSPHLGLELHDAVLENQTIETFQKSSAPKSVATGLLDVNSQKLCPQLHSFVVFSSVSCGRGNAGQSNYGWSNSVMERICEERHSKGLPALAIQWGAVGDVGLVASLQEDGKEFVIGGTLPQKITSCLSLMDTFLLQSCPIVSSMVVAEKQGELTQSANVLDYVAKVLGIKDLKRVNHNAPLAELGMDSMMAVEIKQALEHTLDIFLTAEDIRNLTISGIIEIMKKSKVDAELVHSGGNREESSSIKVETTLSKVYGLQACKLIDCQCLPGRHNVYVFPGVEGDPDTLSTLTSKIHAATLKCFQPGIYDINDHHGTYELAHFILPHILDDLSRVPTFALVGFSFGGVVALELLALLESRGFRGPLVLIDSSPEYAKSSILRMGKDYSLGSLSLYLPKLGCGPNAAIKIYTEGAGLEWPEKLEVAMKLFPDVEIQNSPEVRSYMSTIYNRLTEAVTRRYSYKIFQSPVTLIKSSEESISVADEAYGLKKIFKTISGIHTVPGTHYSIIGEDETANIINNVLEKSNEN